jgi:hypothetical protein
MDSEKSAALHHGVIATALALGLTAEQLKNALSARALPPLPNERPDGKGGIEVVRLVSFALGRFSSDWIERAKEAMGIDGEAIRRAKYERPVLVPIYARRVVVPAMPGVSQPEPAPTEPPATNPIPDGEGVQAPEKETPDE